MTDAPSDTILEVIGLQRKVGDRTIITNLSFTVRAGDIVFVRGASGVGKSLLLRSLAYLDPIQVSTLVIVFLVACPPMWHSAQTTTDVGATDLFMVGAMHPW